MFWTFIEREVFLNFSSFCWYSDFLSIVSLIITIHYKYFKVRKWKHYSRHNLKKGWIHIILHSHLIALWQIISEKTKIFVFLIAFPSSGIGHGTVRVCSVRSRCWSLRSLVDSWPVIHVAICPLANRDIIVTVHLPVQGVARGEEESTIFNNSRSILVPPIIF